MASIYGGASVTVAFVDGTDFRAASAASRGVFVPGLLDNKAPEKDGSFPFLEP